MPIVDGILFLFFDELFETFLQNTCELDAADIFVMVTLPIILMDGYKSEYLTSSSNIIPI